MKQIKIDGKSFCPSKVVCIGRNYVDHIKELNNEMPTQAVIFVKPNSAISERIVSNDIEPIHYEAEISFVINAGVISAVGFGLDLTKRALQSRLKAQSLPWERAKAFDKSAVFSEFVSFSGAVQTLSLQLLINDKLTQHAHYDLMIHKPAAIISEVSGFMSFEAGDVLMTGTPKGVGELFENDHFIGRIFQGDTLLIEQHWIVEG
ncbi:fumarylacetoacetate (FAA) hydrolase [Psychromonas ingrahamii 37]|uniref:Fumarylacetoacetate (FAA) hydrolase n=1 Tax=Psychromonas ingrahamii (strain DSM 17664 / CCUG 51855 / 37) TaxID=357804 RepID=A1SUQ4_PSYIN|nr:fumarylacetoacetate hydrolase family protein [Psychromonas ingrahamii]ABM03219.1 fumarylacetoacetate (FAA) hydrolase [Psychromonas ingrahamii 37]